MTPRPYLSWTQLDLIERSEKKYVDIYFNDGKIPINKGMAFGRDMSDALEKEELTGDALTDILLSKLPTVGTREYKIKTILNDVPLFGKLDDWSKSKLVLNEDKSGVNRWTQKMADKHGQIDFYCTLIYSKYGIKPEDLELYLRYLPTQYNDQGDIEPTGEDPIIFRTHRTFSDVLKMSVRQKKAWARIKELAIEQIV